MATWSETWTWLDGDWHEGNVLVAGPRTHAFWLGSSVFDGARAFEGVTPDLDRHCERLNASARALGLKPTQSVDSIMGLVKHGLRRRRFFRAAESGNDPLSAVSLRLPHEPPKGVLDHAVAFSPPVDGDHANRRQGRLSLSQQRALRNGSEIARF